MTAGSRFKADLERLTDVGRPVGLARFHDGELRVLRGEPYRARSGWHLQRESWLRERLATALSAKLDDYWVGISPPCDYPQGTSFYRPLVKTRHTFATIFWHSNYTRFTSMLSGRFSDACIVSSGVGDFKVPANGVANKWPLDDLVTELLKERRPILVAAGPCACVIVHEYWRRQPKAGRQTILDVGAAIDPKVHGRRTRDFHEPKSALRVHSCSWDRCAPWARPKEKKVRGWAAHRAKHKSSKKATNR